MHLDQVCDKARELFWQAPTLLFNGKGRVGYYGAQEAADEAIAQLELDSDDEDLKLAVIQALRSAIELRVEEAERYHRANHENKKRLGFPAHKPAY